MARGYDTTHETDWTPSIELRFTSLFALSAFVIVEAILEMSVRLIAG